MGEQVFGENAAVQQYAMPEFIVEAKVHLENLEVTKNSVVENIIYYNDL